MKVKVKNVFLFLLAVFVIVFLYSYFSNKSNENKMATANDSIEYKILYSFIQSDPPYAEYDSLIIRKFSNEDEFHKWEKSDTTHKSAERVNK